MSGRLEVEGLTVRFAARGGRGTVTAVDDVSLAIEAGELLGLVGASGCGKSTLARAIVRLVRPIAGTIRFDGRDVSAACGAVSTAFHRAIQIVFQDPWSSLDPRQPIGGAIAEGLAIHRIGTPAERKRRVAALLEEVGLPASAAPRLPDQFSGGQRQRIALARALAVGPQLLICDEAVSALDVSVQAQIVNLLLERRQRDRFACLFITHDIRLAVAVADRIAVMDAGRLVETGRPDAVIGEPRHPSTRALVAAIRCRR